MPDLMHLQILLPFMVFAECDQVRSVVVDTREGLFGLLPQRLDCVAALEPGILAYRRETDGEVFIALDEGILVKAGREVRVSVRNAQGGSDLGKLYAAVKEEFLNLDERERELRAALAKLESGFIRRLSGVQPT